MKPNFSENNVILGLCYRGKYSLVNRASTMNPLEKNNSFVEWLPKVQENKSAAFNYRCFTQQQKACRLSKTFESAFLF